MVYSDIGLLGYSLWFDLLVLVFFLHFFYPKFPYFRLAHKLTFVFVFLSFFWWAGGAFSHNLVEAMWGFLH